MMPYLSLFGLLVSNLLTILDLNLRLSLYRQDMISDGSEQQGEHVHGRMAVWIFHLLEEIGSTFPCI